jgi:carboxypeptidase family protein
MRAGLMTLLVTFGSILLTPLAWAQSATTGSIAGLVRDTTGGVLPGVTVEAASPALIEKVRTVVTDDQGQYKILDLRPGTFTVTFTLAGFGTVKREGLELTTGFTATANAELRVGSIAETVIVSGASPVVDVQNVRTQKVLSHETLDTLPTGKTIQGWAALTLGAVTVGGGQDVGGNVGEAPGSMAIHGGRGNDQQLFMDGMTYNIAAGSTSGQGIILKNNVLASQEITLETSGMSAESEGAGIQINIVPKDGGNIFSGSFVGAYTGSGLQSSNLTDALRARGLTSTSRVKKIYDGGGSFGGPIKRDKLWFFTAQRWWGAEAYVPGNYFNKTPGTLFYTPDFSRQAYVPSPQRDSTVRLTWQVSQKHKVTFLQLVQDNCNCFYAVAANTSPEASGNAHLTPMSLTQVVWTYPVTSRLLLQSGVTYMPNGQKIERTAGVTTSDIPITELSTGYKYGAQVTYDDPKGPTGQNRYDQTNGRFVLSYVTGSHAFKTGFTFFSGTQRADTTTQDPAVSYEVRKPTPDAAPVPVSVTYYAYPRWTKNQGTKFAWYAQDQWTLRDLTLNLGIRVDTLHAWVPAQSKPAGRWTPALDFAKVDDVPNFKDVTPRLGAAYNLFGNGKTAVKASVGRYVIMDFTSLAGATNPQNAIVGSATRTWTDDNHDYIPQENELTALSNSLFGTVFINTRYADDVLKGWGVRPYSWIATASLQHELRPGMGLTVGYFRRWYGNFRVTDNLKVTPADYDPYCITAPVDARLPNGGGNQVCGFYDIKPTAFGAVDNLVTQASHYGKRTEVYNGFDFGINAQLGKGGLLAAGVSTGQVVTDNCFVVDSPQQAQPGFCHATNPFKGQTQIKVSGVYPLPWDLQASAVFQSLAGIPISGAVPLNAFAAAIEASGAPIFGASYVARNAEIAPSLGRDLGACAGRVPCTATATINLLAPYTGGFEDRLTQLDLRLTKIVRMGRVRVRGMFDVYNVFNANTILGGVITRVGPSYLQPTQILAGRLFKFGAQLDF